MKKEKIKQEKGFFGTLFYNNKFVMIFSIVVALLFWILLRFNDTETVPRPISNVPITYKLSDAAQKEGLRVFKFSAKEGTVSVKGNALTVNTFSPEDIQLVPQIISSISGPGLFSGGLNASAKGTPGAYEIVNISPSSVTFTVDYYAEKTFDISMENISGQVAEGYYTAGPSAVTSGSVQVSGPKTLVDSINKVATEPFEAGDGLTASTHFTCNLLLYDANGNVISPEELELSATTADLTFPVLARKTLPLVATFTNSPAGLSLGKSMLTVDPAGVDLAAAPELFNSVKDINLPPIDFSTVSPATNVFDLEVAIPNGLKNLNSVARARVTLNLSGFETREFTVKDFRVKNIAAGSTAKVLTTSRNITIVGPKDELDALTETNFTAYIDMTGKENVAGNTQQPASIIISGGPRCWAFGSYMINVNVTAKS